MAFSAAVKTKFELGGGYGGLVLEQGTWNGAGVTSGNIVADTTLNPKIAEVLAFGASNDQDHTMSQNTSVDQKTLKLANFTSNDTGKYWLIGRPA